MVDYRLTPELDHFTGQIEVFTNLLGHMAGKPIHTLEIGSLEGRSACWMLDNILTHPDATITCVDNESCADTLKQNLQHHANKSRLVLGMSSAKLPQLICEGCKFDFIYIDGGHEDHTPLLDMVLSHELLVDGGIMAIDDYGLDDTEEYGRCRVRQCFFSFMAVYQEYYTTIINAYQQWIKKTGKRA